MCCCAICSFRTGRVEICTRISAMIFGSVPALASGAVAMGFAVNILFVPYGILVVLSSLATLVELLAVILRVCNIRRLNANARVFHVIMIILEFLLMFLYMVGFGISVGLGVFSFGFNALNHAIPLFISTVFCFISIFFFGFLAVWDILFQALNWNEPLRNEPSVEEHEMKA